MTKLRKIILAALLLAAEIVLNRFLSIRTPIVTIGFSFIPMILNAMLLGPVYCTIISGLADLIGALLFPSGAFFPGYTFTALVMGLIYGLILNKSYKKTVKQFTVRIIIACLLVSVLCSVGLNTLWTWYTTKKAAVAIIPTRLVKELIMIPLRVVIMVGMHASFLKFKTYDKLFKTELQEAEESNAAAEFATEAQALTGQTSETEILVKTETENLSETEPENLNETENSEESETENLDSELKAHAPEMIKSEDDNEVTTKAEDRND